MTDKLKDIIEAARSAEIYERSEDLGMEFNYVDKFQQTAIFQDQKAHVDKVVAARDSRKLVYESILEPNTGDAYLLQPGQVIRLEQREDRTCVVDWMFITPDLREESCYGNSAPFQGFYLYKYYQILSQIGRMRPLAVMIADEVPDYFAPDPWSAHFWHWHCSPEWIQMLAPHKGPEQNTCHGNFMHGLARIPAIQAIEDEDERIYTINKLASHHNFQTFQLMQHVHGRDLSGRTNLFVKMGESQPVPYGTGVEFYATEEVYAVLSQCPQGDQRTAVEGDSPLRPSYISVWDTGIEPIAPPQWHDTQAVFRRQIASGEKKISARTGPESYKEE